MCSVGALSPTLFKNQLYISFTYIVFKFCFKLSLPHETYLDTDEIVASHSLQLSHFLLSFVLSSLVTVFITARCQALSYVVCVYYLISHINLMK